MPPIPRIRVSTTALLAAALWVADGQGSPCLANSPGEAAKPRVIVTTDGEADDRCSMVRFLLTSNEFDVEGIVNSSSQFHWEGGTGWHAFHPPSWVGDAIDRYAKVFGNLLLHDPNFPTPDHLRSRWKIGNIGADGEDLRRTAGADLITRVLLDDRDPRPVWVQAWGGTNTISRALRTIQEDYPEKMKEVAGKLRLFLIWEQDESYQRYIRPNWESSNVRTVISDQFDCMAYIWPKVLPEPTKRFFEEPWMKAHIWQGHGPLCAAYEHQGGAFLAEGDTPAFLQVIPTGLRSTESPDWGGWGGRYVKVRNNVWMDPKPSPEWPRPQGRISIHNSWSKKLENVTDPESGKIRADYFKPITRWLEAVQNDFAARADWCVKDFEGANHPPAVRLKDTPLAITAAPGDQVMLDASASEDPDQDPLEARWWHYAQADTYSGPPLTEGSGLRTILSIPRSAAAGEEIHMICEVTDGGTPALTRYQRVVIHVEGAGHPSAKPESAGK